MIYFFHGNDVEKVRTKAFEWVAKARAKEPNLVYVRLAYEELTGAALEDSALSGGLFVKRLLVLIDDPFPSTRSVSEEEDDEEEGSANTLLEEHLDALADSDNAVIVLAPKLSAPKAKKIAGKAKVEYKYDKKSARVFARGFNTNLVDALGNGNRENLWLEVNRALMSGDPPEMLHGLLHWKVRTLIEKRGQKWTQERGRELSLGLIALLQESRRGGLALPLALERFALSI